MDVLCQSWTKVVMLRGARSVFPSQVPTGARLSAEMFYASVFDVFSHFCRK